jgi:uncharacterized membrane protein
MAGIGFELKKLFEKEGIFNKVFAYIHSGFATVGPTLIVIVALSLMYMMPPYIAMPYMEKEVLSSIIMYIFVFALILSSPVNIILSRYMADRIFEEKFGSILTAIETGEGILSILLAVVGIPFGWMLYRTGKQAGYSVLTAYIVFFGLAFTFYYMTVITVLKEYKIITGTFIGCFLIGIGIVYMDAYWLGHTITDSILLGLAASFVLIAVCQRLYIKKVFRVRSGDFRAFFHYIRKHYLLILANLFFTLGIYVHCFVFWRFSEYKIVVLGVFYSAPVYDMATYFAMFSNITILIMFVVCVETKFHTTYKKYFECVIGAGGKEIKKAKQNMMRTMRTETIFVIQVQFIINIVVYILALVCFPKFGVAGDVVTIYPVISVAYMILFLTQCFMIYLFYFDDLHGAVAVGLVFFICTLAGSFAAVHLSTPFLGAGLLFGAFCGFSVAFFRLRYLMVHFDKVVYGRGKIVKRVRGSKLGGVFH